MKEGWARADPFLKISTGEGEAAAKYFLFFLGKQSSTTTPPTHGPRDEDRPAKTAREARDGRTIDLRMANGKGWTAMTRRVRRHTGGASFNKEARRRRGTALSGRLRVAEKTKGPCGTLRAWWRRKRDVGGSRGVSAATSN